MRSTSWCSAVSKQSLLKLTLHRPPSVSSGERWAPIPGWEQDAEMAQLLAGVPFASEDKCLFLDYLWHLQKMSACDSCHTGSTTASEVEPDSNITERIDWSDGVDLSGHATATYADEYM